MAYVYQGVWGLAGKDPVGSGDCVALIQTFAPGLGQVPTKKWRAGTLVIDRIQGLTLGTAIATFIEGRYPSSRRAPHAAFFISSTDIGIWVVDQWKYDPNKPAVSLRHIRRKGRRSDGSFIDPPNNAEAFSVIE